MAPQSEHRGDAGLRERKPRHGRNAVQVYSGAPIVEYGHTVLESGDR